MRGCGYVLSQLVIAFSRKFSFPAMYGSVTSVCYIVLTPVMV